MVPHKASYLVPPLGHSLCMCYFVDFICQYEIVSLCCIMGSKPVWMTRSRLAGSTV